MKKIFAEDFLGTDTDGKLYTKSEKIAEEKARTSTDEVLSPRLDDVKVRFFGDNLAVLYGRESSIRKSKEGKEYTRRVIWTDTDVLRVELPNTPGALAKFAGKLGEEDINHRRGNPQAQGRWKIVMPRWVGLTS